MQECEKDWVDFKKHHRKYRNQVDCISKVFRLEKKPLLDISPAYFAGQYNKWKCFVIFGINPGYKKENNEGEEEILKNKNSFEDYMDYFYNFFNNIDHQEFKSPYFEEFWKLFSGMSGNYKAGKIKYNFFHEEVTNMNLIPYHSSGISMPSEFSKIQFGYLKYRLDLNMDFISQYKPKLLIFNGKPWYTLFRKHNLVDIGEPTPITKKFNLYFFPYNGISAVLFDKFFTSNRWGLTPDDRRSKIPQLILARYPHLSTTHARAV